MIGVIAAFLAYVLMLASAGAPWPADLCRLDAQIDNRVAATSSWSLCPKVPDDIRTGR